LCGLLLGDLPYIRYTVGRTPKYVVEAFISARKLPSHSSFVLFTGVVFQSVANLKSAEEAYRTSWHQNSCASNSARFFFPAKKVTDTSMSQEVSKEKA